MPGQPACHDGGCTYPLGCANEEPCVGLCVEPCVGPADRPACSTGRKLWSAAAATPALPLLAPLPESDPGAAPGMGAPSGTQAIAGDHCRGRAPRPAMRRRRRQSKRPRAAAGGAAVGPGQRDGGRVEAGRGLA
eukprot:358614-Chlamydomonas_euryale.AAC.3